MAVPQDGSVVGGTAGGIRDDGGGQSPGAGIGSGPVVATLRDGREALHGDAFRGVDPRSGKSEGESGGRGCLRLPAGRPLAGFALVDHRPVACPHYIDAHK